MTEILLCLVFVGFLSQKGARLCVLSMGMGALIFLLGAIPLSATSARTLSYATGAGSDTMLDIWITANTHELFLGVGLFFAGACLAGPGYSGLRAGYGAFATLLAGLLVYVNSKTLIVDLSHATDRFSDRVISAELSAWIWPVQAASVAFIAVGVLRLGLILRCWNAKQS